MRNVKCFFIIFSAMLGLLAQDQTFPVIPTPQEVLLREGTFRIASAANYAVVCEGGIGVDFKGAQLISEALNENRGIVATVVGNKPTKATRIITLALDADGKFAQARFGRGYSPEMQAEGYFLEIQPEMITILGPTPRGLFYGAVTLVQLLRGSPGSALPAVFIADYPALQWRGVSDDISRGQVSSLANFKQIVRFLAEYKQNIYMPYLEDVVQIEKYPTIGVGRGALSRAELTELQDYAAEYFVEVIPIFQTLGHFENILHLPEFVKYAEFPGAASLNSLDSAADEFLMNLLDEVIPLFRSEYFHIGADESWDVGLGATREQALKDGVAALHARHYNKVYNKVRAHGKRVLMYGDIILRHPEILSLIPKDIIIVDWHYNLSDIYPSAKQLADSGFQVLVSPGIHNWHNPFPNLTNAKINIAGINLEGYRNRALGSINSNWGDFGGPNFRELNYAGYAFGAETAWNPVSQELPTLLRRYNLQRYGTDDERLLSLFLHLNEIPNNTNFKEFWRSPFYKADEQSARSLWRAEQLEGHCSAALALCELLRPVLKRNQSDLDYYQFVARLGLVSAAKLRAGRRLELLRQNAIGVSPAELSAAADDCAALVREITVLEQDYKALWLRTNRPENLSRILNLFNKLAVHLECAGEEISRGNLNFPVELTARFITARSVVKDEKPAPAYLRRSFTINEPDSLMSASLQLIANSQATIYVNGEKIGGVIGTRSLSLVVENQRVGWWEVQKKINRGTNWLAVEVQSHKPQLPSAANVYLELIFKDGRKVVVQSDTDWEAQTQVKSGWLTGQDKGLKWNAAQIADKINWKISAPLFQRGFASRIEF